MTALVALAALPGLVTSAVAAAALRVWAPRWGLTDRPGHRKIHAAPVPFGGGIAIWLGVVLPLALGQIGLSAWYAVYRSDPQAARLDWSRWGSAGERLAELVEPHLPGLYEQSIDLWFFLACGTVLMLLGLVDDVRRIDWRFRLAVEFLVAGAVVFGRGWTLTFFVDTPWLTQLVSLFWIVGLVNAFNFLDNMDGLAGGVAAICATVLAAVMLLTPEDSAHAGQWFIAGFLLLLVGSLVGFLLHNRPPARIFMGDAGSYFIGFCLAIMTILGTYSPQGLPRHSVLAPLCILAVPLYDMASVVLIRLRAGRSPFEGDTNHFSHRLVALGLSRPQAVLTIYLTTAACGLGALVLQQVNAFGAAMIVSSIVCLLAVIAILEATARRRLN